MYEGPLSLNDTKFQTTATAVVHKPRDGYLGILACKEQHYSIGQSHHKYFKVSYNNS